MNMEEYRERRQQEKRRRMIHNILVIVTGFLLIAALVTGGIILGRYRSGFGSVKASVHQTTAETTAPEIITTAAETEDTGLTDLLAQAESLAVQYDYEGAINLITSDSRYASTKEAADAVAAYTDQMSRLVRINPQEVTHVFFHSLIVDTSKAFDGDSREGGYNQMMTTKDEFIKMMQSMYDRGYVLVKIHDLAYETTDENGNPKFVYGDIMLPEGKKAFVMSQDDVCYYEYMKGDGFATRMVIGKTVIPPPRWSRRMEASSPEISISFPYWKPLSRNTRDFLIRAQEPLSPLPAITEFLDTGQMNLIRTPIPITRRT